MLISYTSYYTTSEMVVCLYVRPVSIRGNCVVDWGRNLLASRRHFRQLPLYADLSDI